MLDAYGIRTPRRLLATSAREAATAAESLGFPVVVKLASADMLHKSDEGFVRVGLQSAREVRTVAADFLARKPDADGVIVAEQVAGGIECVVGVSHDDLFGPVVMFGLGGVFVEVLRDVTFRVPPFGRDEAGRMLDELAGATMLRGVRGRPGADRRALIETIMKVQRLAVDLHDDVAELDINPLIALPDGCVALDALVVPR